MSVISLLAAVFSVVCQLHVAAANGYLSVVKYLLDNQVAVGPCDKDDWRPIHAAACWGHVSHRWGTRGQ